MTTGKRSLFSALLLTSTLAGCAGYADLYTMSQPPGAQVIALNDGQSIDDGTGTPAEVLFERSHYPYGTALRLLFYKECYRPVFQTINIDRWYETSDEAKKKPNRIYINLTKLTNCVPAS